MRARGVVRGSMAEDAGLEPGDLVVALTPPVMPLRSLSELRVATRRAAEGETISFIVERAGARFERAVRTRPRPAESIAGHAVLYDHVISGGARLRTIVTRPEAQG